MKTRGPLSFVVVTVAFVTIGHTDAFTPTHLTRIKTGASTQLSHSTKPMLSNNFKSLSNGVTQPSTGPTLSTYMPEKKLPPKRNRVANSTKRLSRMDMQRAMTDVKRFVEERLEEDLHLVKVRASLYAYTFILSND